MSKKEMKRTYLLFLSALLSVIMPISKCGASSIISNVPTEVEISNIDIWNNSLTIRYIDRDNSGERINNVNIAYATTNDPSESEIMALQKARPYWAQTWFLKYISSGVTIFNNSEVTINKANFGSAVYAELKNNEKGILYYATQMVDSADKIINYEYGVADYNSCIKADGFEEGVVCRAEFVEGNIIYVPYKGKVRLEPYIEKINEGDKSSDTVGDDKSGSSDNDDDKGSDLGYGNDQGDSIENNEEEKGDSDANIDKTSNKEIVAGEASRVLAKVSINGVVKNNKTDNNLRTGVLENANQKESVGYKADNEPSGEKNESGTIVTKTNTVYPNNEINVPELGNINNGEFNFVGIFIVLGIGLFGSLFWFLWFYLRKKREDEEDRA